MLGILIVDVKTQPGICDLKVSHTSPPRESVLG